MSLRDLSPLLERIIDAGYAAPRPDADRFLLLDDPVTAARTDVGAGPGDPAWLEAFVRTGLRSQIAAQHSGGQNTLAVCLLDARIDELLRQHSCAPDQARRRGCGMSTEASTEGGRGLRPGRYGRCPCGGLYMERRVKIRVVDPQGTEHLLTKVPQGCCVTCSMRVYKLAVLQRIERVYRGANLR